LALPRPETRSRIEGWLPVNSRVMVAAQFKAGKTTLMGNLLRSLVDGDDWLEAADVEPITGHAVLIDTEMAQTQLDDWHRDQGIQADDRIVPVSLRGSLTAFNLLDRSVRTEWAARLRTLGTQYLILDCLRPILDALGLDEQHEAGRFLVAFDALLVEAAIPEAAVIHHMGHAGERSRGDSRLRDWPDVEWLLVRKNPDAASPRFISAYGRDVEIPESELAYDPKQRRLKLTGGGTRSDVNIQEALAAVLEVLKDSKPRSFRQLQNEAQRRCGFTRECVRNAIAFGVASKKIVTEPGPRRATLHRLP
ncbi:MAG: AAA family ATPase, partial [Gammaproteobacteria bacterium]